MVGIVVACATKSATLVRVSGDVLWYEHPLIQAKIRQCKRVDEKLGVESSCRIEVLN